ncbi:hypothetical protein [Deinococcus hopiensis]|uniref:Uncharacterized protein n=1 Tax=Deinococcus hopiensis KR-140 TaxID=695939 RepID=A0A1W1UDT9_9DEIO|nr:hypothetical protein [Deinococcus hopiensis]SMB79203.1 hypothetical protein SAMN00790413_05832 [Deinococcus hopiensis KR-140]
MNPSRLLRTAQIVAVLWGGVACAQVTPLMPTGLRPGDVPAAQIQIVTVAPLPLPTSAPTDSRTCALRAAAAVGRWVTQGPSGAVPHAESSPVRLFTGRGECLAVMPLWPGFRAQRGGRDSAGFLKLPAADNRTQ